MSGIPVVLMEGITKTYPGVTALAGVDLTLDQGEVLGLVGANGAGKSTLMNVLGGVIHPDSGDIRVAGELVHIRNPRQSQALGIAFVQQEVATFGTLSVVDNLFITDFPVSGPVIRRTEMRRRSEAVLQRLGCSFGPDDIMDDLSTGDRQMVTIARALLSNPKVIILDEPTSSLSLTERQRLFQMLKTLRAEGVSFVYISHFLDEVFSVCQRVTVMRNGRVAGAGRIRDVTLDQVVEWMIGGTADHQPLHRSAAATGDPVLEVRGLQRDGVLTDIDLTVRRGEIVGIWGLMGSGRTELARAIVGLDHMDGGTILIDDGRGLAAVKRSRRQRHIGFVPEDRRQEGLFLPMSVPRNIGMASLRVLSRFGMVSGNRESRLADRFIEQLGIKMSSKQQQVRTLSGGNQQKVVLARWLALAPPVFILDEPMRGLDIGAKAQIRALIAELADGGAAIVVIDSELQELRLLADRFIVLHRGRIAGECPRDTPENALMAMAAGAGLAA